MNVSIFRRDGRKGFTLKSQDGRGRDRMRQFRTRRLAEEEALRLREIGTLGDELTFQDHCDRWARGAKQSLRPNTLRVYDWALRVHIIPEFGAVPLSRISRATVKDFVIRKLESGLARKTVGNIHNVLHVCLEDAVDIAILRDNPADRRGRSKALRLQPTRAERAAKVKAFTSEQLGRFLSAAERKLPDRWVLFRVMALTGMRLSEVLGLKWQDVDLDAGVVTIRRGWVRNRVQMTKSGHARQVDLSSRLVEDLAAWRSAHTPGAFGDATPDWLFPSKASTPVDHNYIQRDFKRVLQAARLPRHFTPHCLRHTYATLLIKAGESIEYVQKQLGHSTIQLTVDVYGSWLPSGNRAVVNRLEGQVGEVGRPRRAAENVT